MRKYKFLHRIVHEFFEMLVVFLLPRQRNLWVTDTVEWCREGRLA
jgi:hypothetical protein